MSHPTNIKISDLEAYLGNLYQNIQTDQSLFMKLIEEIGEVAEVLNKKTGRKDTNGEDLQEQLGNELADVIHYAVAIAAWNNLDLNKVILEKDRAASIKYHHHNLEEFIAKSGK